MLSAPDERVAAVARGRLEAVALGTASERQDISALAAFVRWPSITFGPLAGCRHVRSYETGRHPLGTEICNQC